MTDELRQACAKAMHVVTTDGTVHRGGRASMFILRKTGWGWFAALLMVPPFVWFVELGYWIVARNRGFFGKFMFRRE
jgi:predicted DCC family thiol-disulfide oxidoreductase YuxK